MTDYGNNQVSALIDEYIHSARNRDIVKDRLVDGLSYKELESKYFLSQRQLKRIVSKADKILIKLI